MGFLEGFTRRPRPAVAKRTPSPAHPAHAGSLPQALDHGAYYTGKLGVKPVVARWHAKRRRFVFEEFALGGKRVRSVPHALDAASGERFIPIAKIEPKNEQRLSDYAFDTGG